MLQITQAQMRELRTLLASVGLDVKRKPQPKGNDELSRRLDRVRAWRPRNGGACKSEMLATLNMVKQYGYSNDRYGWSKEAK